MTLAKNIPQDLSNLLQAIAADFPVILGGNLVGIYLWGSLTYNAFEQRCSDVDSIVVTARDLDDREFSDLDAWFKNQGQLNRWVKRIDLRFVIDHEFLDKASRCCGFYHYTQKLVRHGSDGNPIIWMNIAECGVTLWGKDAKLIAPPVSGRCFNEALLEELNYLKEDLNSNRGDRSDRAFIHNAYAVLTACRILYSAHHGTVLSKEQAYTWAIETVPVAWRSVIHAARENRLKYSGATTPELEQNAIRFIRFVTSEVTRILEQSNQI
jgi:Domain of unknown function (DUF4111)